MAMLTIHHLVKSCSERIVWLAEELGMPYELKVHHRDPVTQRAPAAIKQLSPFGKAPVIEHDSEVVAESAAVIDYMLDKFDNGRLRPAPGTREYLDYRFWMYASEATMKPPLIVEVLTSHTGCAITPVLKQFLREECVAVFDHLDKVLRQRDYVAGAFSGADLMIWYELRIARNANMPGTLHSDAPIGEYPRILDYMARLESRPAYQKAAVLCAGDPAATSDAGICR